MNYKDIEIYSRCNIVNHFDHKYDTLQRQREFVNNYHIPVYFTGVHILFSEDLMYYIIYRII